MLKNILELLKVSNKGYSIVFMNQLLTDIQRCDNYQTLPISKGENLLLTNVVNELGYRFNSDETLQKVVKAQSYIRRFLYHKRYITHKTFSASKFQQYNSTFLNLHEKQIHYIENIETLLYYFDELRAQPNFQFLNEYPYKEYYESIRCILDVEKVFKRGLDDINGTFPKVAGVGQVVSKYCENALSAYRELSLQGAVVMALVCYERKNSQFKEAHELLSKGQTYPFRYLLQSFPRLTHIDDIINAIESMNKAVETLEEYKEETVPLKKCYDEITTLKKDITNPLVTESTTSETSSTTNQINPEFNDFLLKIKKEFSKTPSVVEVYMKLGMDVGDIEQKRLLKESRVTVEVHPNIDQFPPNLKANLQSVSVTSLTTGKTEKKSTTSLRPRLQKRTDRQKQKPN
ncbi:Rho-GAP domain-containing protein [Entamoeba marina]